jgi:hypothetical protein
MNPQYYNTYPLVFNESTGHYTSVATGHATGLRCRPSEGCPDAKSAELRLRLHRR